MRIIGLTGGIGVGKSTVAGMLEEHGAVVIDVDGLGREVLEPGGLAVQRVAERFGTGVVGDDGGIDRRALAAIVFADADDLRALEAISHPAIDAAIDARLAELDDDAVVVLDMAVLVESTLGRCLPSGRGYDTVVVVEAPMDVRLERLVARGHTLDDARARMAAQAADDERRAMAHHIVVNDAGLDTLAERVDALWPALSAGSPPTGP
ncbi:MAG: dephospho-CoA kinase [Acidimicrobiales bacterium]|nr:dephospho-CoA kinase [Acidimicrobiales bacterium]